MTALASKWPTLLDVSKRLDPDGSIATIAEMLTEKNAILEDMPWFEGNLPTGHRHTIRTGLPEPTWRKMYGGVQPTKSTTTQVTDTTGNLEAYAEVDKALADLNGNTAAFRLSEDRPHIDGIAKELAQTFFYGNEGTEPEAFTGIAPRMNSTTEANGQMVIKAGGVGSDNTSIYLCVFGEQGGWGIYPKGSKAGLEMEDKGQVTIENVDGNGGRMEAYRSHYVQKAGFAMKDWRQFARICNIDASLMHVAANAKELVRYMIIASERVEDIGAGRPVFYVNRHIMTQLRIGILEKIATNLTWETVAGKRVMIFDEIPVKRCDAITNSETLVS
jgi:hypothetical protein